MTAPGEPNASSSRQAESLLAGVKGWIHDGLELVRVRLELVGLEAGHQARHVAQSVALALAATFFLCLGLAFVAMLFTVLFWESHRVLVLALFSAMFITLAGVGFWLLRRKLHDTRRWFEATVEELTQDVQRLKS